MLDNILNRVRPERKYPQEELKKRLPPGQSLHREVARAPLRRRATHPT